MPPTKNSLQKDRQLQEAQIGFPSPFSHRLAECKLKDQKAVMSQMCVKTRVVYEVGKAQARQKKGKKKHYYYVPGIMFAPIQTTTEVANSKRAWTFSWTTLLSKTPLHIRKGRKEGMGILRTLTTAAASHSANCSASCAFHASVHSQMSETVVWQSSILWIWTSVNLNNDRCRSS